MASTAHRNDVIVVGAGLIGAAFALQLARNSDYDIALVERSARQRVNPVPNQRVVALGTAATGLLSELNILAELGSASCYPYTNMRVWDEFSDGALTFSASDYQQPCLGHLVDAVQLTLLLQYALEKQHNIQTIYDFHASELRLEHDRATLVGESDQLGAQLIVAADGANSWARRQAKIFAHQHAYQQKGIVARIRTQQSHQDTAWQIFLKTGPLAVLPLADNQSSIVWSANNEKADELMAMSDELFAKAVTGALQNRLGTVELLTERQAFPLRSLSADSYFKHRLALIGDAAHSIHPLAGQGANLGFKDVIALVDSLIGLAPEKLGELDVLKRYERRRRADNIQTDQLMSALHTAYQTDSPWWRAARGQGMNWLGGSALLKRVLARQAMGY